MSDELNGSVNGNLRKFLTSQHVEFGNISCMRIPGPASRGIVATADIKSGEILLSVPKRLLMGVDSALEDESIAKAVEAGSKDGLCLSDQQLLAIHLLRECSKGLTSFWAPYITTIPRSYSTGYSLNDGHIEELQFPYAKRFLYEAQEECLASYTTAQSILGLVFEKGSKWSTLHAWKWALSTLSSRTMYMPNNTIGVLCPYGDLHNYMWPPPPITMILDTMPENPRNEGSMSGEGYFDATRDMYVLVSRRQYSKGEEVHLCYGRHTNLHLLRYYGFCLEDNPHNTAMIPIVHFPQKVQQHIMSEDDVYVHTNGYPSFQLMRSLRMSSLDSADRKKYAFKVLNDESVHPLSEITAFSMLMKAVQHTLDHHTSTSIEKDLELLHASDIDECMFAVISFRLYQKQMLQRCLRICKRYISTLTQF
jgi:hypothetical protein